MPKLYVVIDAKTGDFFSPKSNSRRPRTRKVNAYISEHVARAAMRQFWPRPEESDYIIKEYGEVDA